MRLGRTAVSLLPPPPARSRSPIGLERGLTPPPSALIGPHRCHSWPALKARAENATLCQPRLPLAAEAEGRAHRALRLDERDGGRGSAVAAGRETEGMGGG